MGPCARASACYGPLVSCPPDWRALMLPAVRTALISYRPTGRSLRIRPSCADISTRMHVKHLGRESRAVDYSGSLISGRGKSRARFAPLIASPTELVCLQEVYSDRLEAAASRAGA